MKRLVFATNNDHKLEELRQILPHYTILGLRDIGIDHDIPETGRTLEENAKIKAQYLFDHSAEISLSEDTGLEIHALDGAPGVDTAHYSGTRDPHANMSTVLTQLADNDDRSAQFRTVIAYINGEQTLYFEGIVRGHIATEMSGEGGFGYDPIFIPEGYDETFAALSAEVKKNISHRARAVKALIEWLSNP
jgi:XTP/dITP diphosphohydrolase